jgi:hypothetical protein
MEKTILLIMSILRGTMHWRICSKFYALTGFRQPRISDWQYTFHYSAMINLKKGEFKLDEYKLVIHPDLALSSFKASDIPLEELLSNEKGEISFEFKASLEALEATFQMFFAREVFYRLRIYFDKKYKLGPGKPIEDWLTKVTGEFPPFEYGWGCLLTEIDDRSDNDFSVLTKYNILALGFRNVESFYNFRNE